MAKDNTLPILTHVLAIFTGFIGPLIIYLVAENKTDKNHARTALNWQFSLLIWLAISFVLAFVIVGIFLIIALSIMNIIYCIIAAVRASEGQLWQYPTSIRFFKVE